MATFNVEDINANHPFITSTLSYIDILNIQEHWLFCFEQDQLGRVIEEMSYHIRSADEKEFITPVAKPRGYGGVATLWKKWLDPYVIRLPDGNERIICTQFKLPDEVLTIINCYLPSAKTSKALEQYNEDIAAINELLTKFSETSQVLLLGDLNADIYGRSGHKEKLLADLIKQHTLQDLGQDSANIPTYRHMSLDHRSHVDYILVKGGGRRWGSAIIKEHDDEDCAINASTHVPVCTKSSISIHVEEKKEDKLGALTKKWKWEEADVQVYNDTIKEELSRINIEWMTPAEALNVVSCAIEAATTAAVPSANKHRKDKPKGKPWYPELQDAVNAAKARHKEWTAAGRPKENHSLQVQKRKAKKQVRRVARQHEAAKRDKHLNKIMLARESDEKLFYSLVKKQRTGSVNYNIRLDDGSITCNDDIIRHAWTQHFEKLATPNAADMCAEYEILDGLYQTLHRDLVMGKVDAVTPAEVMDIIRNMSAGKAADQNGLTAEQLKLAPSLLAEPLSMIIQKILEDTEVPKNLKAGYKIPLPKPGKDPLDRNNYRGITITPLMGKLLETVLLNRAGPLIEKAQSQLQFGFTKGMAPTMASLCLAEALAVAKDTKKNLYVTTLDASKAFDVVDHGILKVKVFNTGIGGQLWKVIDNLYEDCSEVVRWNGEYGPSYTVRQGVRQGGTLSPSLYKLYINHLLSTLESGRLGCSIGNIYLGSPTCADDVLLLSNDKEEMQTMIDVCAEYAHAHKYKLHPAKSQVIHHIKTSKQGTTTSPPEWKMGAEQISETSAFTHLGLNWAAGKMNPIVKDKVGAARKTAYALMGVGLHGTNGLDPGTAVHMIKTYVLPKLLFGLDSVTLTRKDVDMLESYYRGLLKQIQGLPETTANEAVYLLVGALPLEAALHLRLLGVFGTISRLQNDHTLYKLALRQMALMEHKSHSWFVYICDIAARYDIDLHQVLLNPWRKREWKRYTRTLVEGYWWDKLMNGASTKSSLSWLDLSGCRVNKAHEVWKAARGNNYQIEAATIRIRMLVGKYMVQGNRARYNQNAVNPACPLCSHPKEDMMHFIAECPALEEYRTAKQASLVKLCLMEGIACPNSGSEWCGFILNGPATDSNKMTNNGSDNKSINRLCNLLCIALHKARDIQINDRLIEKQTVL